MKSRRINSFHYFARLSFLSKSENAKGYNEIEKKFFGYLTLRDVSRNVGFVCFRIFSYMNRIVFGFSRIWNRIVDSTILSIHGKYWCDSVHVRENTGKRKPIFWDISRSVKVKNFISASKVIRRQYVWLLHSILRISTIQRLSQFTVAWQNASFIFSCENPIFFSLSFTFSPPTHTSLGKEDPLFREEDLYANKSIVKIYYNIRVATRGGDV